MWYYLVWKNQFLIFKDISWNCSQPENRESYKKGKLIETFFEIFMKRILKNKKQKVAENKNRARFDRRRPAAHQLQVFSNFRLLWFFAKCFETVWLPSTLHKLIKMRKIFSRCATASSAPSCRCLTSLSGRAVDDCLTIRFHFLFFFCFWPFFHFHSFNASWISFSPGICESTSGHVWQTDSKAQ